MELVVQKKPLNESTSNRLIPAGGAELWALVKNSNLDFDTRWQLISAGIQSINELSGAHIVLTKANIGLGNVDNTSDANKPISTAAQTALDAKADLVGGKIPTSQIPAIAIGETFSVASEAAMLALTAQMGDVAIRTDAGNAKFLLLGTDPSVLNNWKDMTTAGVTGVSSINSLTGAVVLGKADIGLGNVPNVDATQRSNHTGTQSADTLTDGTTNKAFTATERTKLAGIATGATANDTDANLKNRSNHTGTQAASTISDFASTVRATQAGTLPTGTATPIASTDTLPDIAAKAKYQIQIVSGGAIVVKPTSGNDITSAVNSAISSLSGTGGRVLIPDGVFSMSSGGITSIPSGITIEGLGQRLAVDSSGTKIQMASGATGAMFTIDGVKRDITFRNLTLDFGAAKTVDAILITNPGNASQFVYKTKLDNVVIQHARVGLHILNHTTTTNPFECILTDVNECAFIACKIGFYCNTNNSGFIFRHPYIALANTSDGHTVAGIGWHCYLVGNLEVYNPLVVGRQSPRPLGMATDGSTMLVTEGQFNRIYFLGGQSELNEFTYKKLSFNYAENPIIFEKMLIQSKIYGEKHCTVVSRDNYLVNFGGSSATNYSPGATFYDESTNAYMHLHLEGKNTVETRDSSQAIQSTGTATYFANPLSRVYDPAGNVRSPKSGSPLSVSFPYYTGKKLIDPEVVTGTGTQTINGTRGVVRITNGQSSISVYNWLVNSDTIIKCQALNYDADALFLKYTKTAGTPYYFTIFLTGAVAEPYVDVYFELVNGDF